jgi:hypothetical protein
MLDPTVLGSQDYTLHLDERKCHLLRSKPGHSRYDYRETNFSDLLSMCPTSGKLMDIYVEENLSGIRVNSLRKGPVVMHFSADEDFQMNVKRTTCIPSRIYGVDLGNPLGQLSCDVYPFHLYIAIHEGKLCRPVESVQEDHGGEVVPQKAAVYRGDVDHLEEVLFREDYHH